MRHLEVMIAVKDLDTGVIAFQPVAGGLPKLNNAGKAPLLSKLYPSFQLDGNTDQEILLKSIINISAVVGMALYPSSTEKFKKALLTGMTEAKEILNKKAS